MTLMYQASDNVVDKFTYVDFRLQSNPRSSDSLRNKAARQSWLIKQDSVSEINLFFLILLGI